MSKHGNTTLFGYPLFIGKIKLRVAKRTLYNLWKYWKAYPELRNVGVGDLVWCCTGFNHRIEVIEPQYYRIKNGSQILFDIDVKTNGPYCSLTTCGIKPAKSRENIEKRYLEFVKDWGLGTRGETWFGKEYPEHKQRFTRRI